MLCAVLCLRSYSKCLIRVHHCSNDTIAQKGFRWNLQALLSNLSCIIVQKAMHDRVAQYKSSRSQCTRDLLDLLGKHTHTWAKKYPSFCLKQPCTPEQTFPHTQTTPFSDFLFFLALYWEIIWKGIGDIRKTFSTLTLKKEHGLGRWKSPSLSLNLDYN